MTYIQYVILYNQIVHPEICRFSLPRNRIARLVKLFMVGEISNECIFQIKYFCCRDFKTLFLMKKCRKLNRNASKYHWHISQNLLFITLSWKCWFTSNLWWSFVSFEQNKRCMCTALCLTTSAERSVETHIFRDKHSDTHRTCSKHTLRLI